MSEWQPIGTAPQDDTEVLLFVEGERKIAKWSSKPQWWPWDNKPHRPCWVGVTCGDDWFNEYWERDKPTHWMPLPEPPK